MKALTAVPTLVFIISLVASSTPSDRMSYRLPFLASQIYSAAFNDVSPGFDDLYVIKTQDKGREIIIYCNTTYCYKNRNSVMTG